MCCAFLCADPARWVKNSTLICTRDDVTMVNEFKQSTILSSTRAKKNVQVNTFPNGCKGLIVNTIIVCVKEVISEVCIFNL